MKKDYRLTALSLGILAFAALMMVSANKPQDMIKARAFYLVDSKGELIGGMDANNKDEPNVFLAGSDRNVKLNITVDKNGPRINLFGEGRAGISMSTSSFIMAGETITTIIVPKAIQGKYILIKDSDKILWFAPDDR